MCGAARKAWRVGGCLWWCLAVQMEAQLSRKADIADVERRPLRNEVRPPLLPLPQREPARTQHAAQTGDVVAGRGFPLLRSCGRGGRGACMCACCHVAASGGGEPAHANGRRHVRDQEQARGDGQQGALVWGAGRREDFMAFRRPGAWLCRVRARHSAACTRQERVFVSLPRAAAAVEPADSSTARSRNCGQGPPPAAERRQTLAPACAHPQACRRGRRRASGSWRRCAPTWRASPRGWRRCGRRWAARRGWPTSASSWRLRPTPPTWSSASRTRCATSLLSTWPPSCGVQPWTRGGARLQQRRRVEGARILPGLGRRNADEAVAAVAWPRPGEPQAAGRAAERQGRRGGGGAAAARGAPARGGPGRGPGAQDGSGANRRGERGRAARASGASAFARPSVHRSNFTSDSATTWSLARAGGAAGRAAIAPGGRGRRRCHHRPAGPPLPAIIGAGSSSAR